MKKFLLLASLLLAGCTQGTTISGQAVIDGVHATCGIVVPVVDIAALVNANPALTSVASIVDAICSAFRAQAVKAAPVKSVSGTLIVDGVLVHYEVK